MQYVETGIIGTIYLTLLFIAIRIYLRQETKGKWWAIVPLFFVGLFSISFELSLFGQMYKLAILPLGAGLFFLFTMSRHEVRKTYKPYIWLGFLANYGFFIGGIVTIFLTNALFPPGQLLTYIKSFEEATIMITHPSVQDEVHLTKNAYELLEKSVPTEVQAHEWYNEQAYNQRAYKVEKFPYMLQNVTAPAGMNMDVFYYIEQDGQGLLMQTPNRHYYFRTSDTFIEKDGEQR